MKRQAILATVAVAALMGLSACHKTGTNANNDVANPGDSAPVNAVQDAAAGPVGVTSAATANTAQEFVSAAAMSDMYEVEAGKIAAERAKRADVKMFAKMMVEAHSKTTADLKKVIADNKIDVAPPAALDDRRTGMLNNLKAAGDSDFDLAYLHQQAAAHIEALTLMSTYADHGDNEALKAAAAKTKTVVQEHLDHLKKVGGDAIKADLPG